MSCLFLIDLVNLSHKTFKLIKEIKDLSMYLSITFGNYQFFQMIKIILDCNALTQGVILSL